MVKKTWLSKTGHTSLLMPSMKWHYFHVSCITLSLVWLKNLFRSR